MHRRNGDLIWLDKAEEIQHLTNVTPTVFIQTLQALPMGTHYIDTSEEYMVHRWGKSQKHGRYESVIWLLVHPNEMPAKLQAYALIAGIDHGI